MAAFLYAGRFDGYPYISFYNEIAVTLFDQIYFVQMRMYFQTRVGERMMFAWGMSDGRN